MVAPAAVSTFSSSSSVAHRPQRRLPAAGRSTRTLLPPARTVASSRAPLVVSSPPPTPAPGQPKVDPSGRFCSPRAARELADGFLRGVPGGRGRGAPLRPQGRRTKRGRLCFQQGVLAELQFYELLRGTSRGCYRGGPEAHEPE